MTAHYLPSTSQFDQGDPARRSANFEHPRVRAIGRLRRGIFKGQEGVFTAIAAPDPDVSVQKPILERHGDRGFFYKVILRRGRRSLRGRDHIENRVGLTTVVDTESPVRVLRLQAAVSQLAPEMWPSMQPSTTGPRDLCGARPAPRPRRRSRGHADRDRRSEASTSRGGTQRLGSPRIHRAAGGPILQEGASPWRSSRPRPGLNSAGIQARAIRV